MPSPLRLVGWIWPPGPASARPVLENGQEARAYLRAIDEDGSPATPTGLSFELRRPDGSVQVLEGAAIQVGERPGEVFAAFQADQNGLWRWQWIGTGPTEARDGGAFRVQSSTVRPPDPGAPVLSTEDLAPLATEGGGLLRVKRVTALPRASSSSGLVVVGAQAGEARHFPAEQLSGPNLVVDGGLGAAPGQRPTVNDAAAIIAAGQEVYSRWGGGRVLLVRSHRIDAPVPLPPGVDIGYATPPGGPRLLRPSQQLGLFEVPALYIGANGYLSVQHSVRGLALIRDGLTAPVSAPSAQPWSAAAMEDALDRQMAFSGTPLRVTGAPNTISDDLEIADISGYGFEQLLHCQGGARHSISNIRGDNQSLIRLEESGGEPRVEKVYSRTYVSGGGTTAIACPILAASNTGGLLTLIVAPPREPPSTKEWRPNTYYTSSTKIYWAGNLYRVLTDGTSGTTPPTHTQGRALNGDTTLTWQRVWSGVNLAPATSIPKTTGGFLKPGHSVILQVPPYDCYTGNPTYPHWSTPGAPAEIVADGGDLLDPMMRGRYTVQALGAADADSATIILDCPYDAGLAAATANRYLLIMPGMRFGTAIRTHDVDACQFAALQSKAQRFHLWANGATHTVIGDQYEESSTGESEVEDWGSIGYLVDRLATRFEVLGSASKTKGTLFYIAGSGANVIRLKALARGAGFRSVDHKSGHLDAELLFEGPAIVYSRSTARHMALRWSGVKPAIVGDTDPAQRVSLDGYVAAPTDRRRARSIVGARGVRLGIGSTIAQYQAGGTYGPNALVWNELLGEQGAWVYRNVSVAAGQAGTGVGPQHTSGTEVDGACSWVSVGAYSGGIDSIEIDSTGEVTIWDAATGPMGPRQKVAKFSRTAPEFYGEWWQVTPDAAEAKTPVVSRRGDVRVRSRTTAQASTTDADAAASGRSRLVRLTDAPGAPTLALAFEDEEPVPLARLDGTGAVALPGVPGAFPRPWVERLLERIHVKETGARGDDVTDDSAAFLNLEEYIRPRKLPLRIPTADVAYRVSETLLLRSGTVVQGKGHNSLIRWAGGGSKPVIARYNWQDREAGEVDEVVLRAIRIDDWTLTTGRDPAAGGAWTIDLSNGSYHTLEDVEIEGDLAAGVTHTFGALLGKVPGSSYPLPVWVHTVTRPRFQRAMLWVMGTDGFINFGEVYGFGRECAIRLGGGNSIIGTNLVGGETYGALYIRGPDATPTEIFSVKTSGGHWDGNNTRNTGRGIYAPPDQPIRSCSLATGTTMWNADHRYIDLQDARSCQVGAGATFRQGDARDLGHEDVYIRGRENILAAPTMVRSNIAAKKGATVAVATLSRTAGAVAAVTQVPHGFTAGDTVTITDAPGFNGTFSPITILSSTSFAYADGLGDASATGGFAIRGELRVNAGMPFRVVDVGGRNLIIPGTISHDGRGYRTTRWDIQSISGPDAEISVADDFTGLALDATRWATHRGTDAAAGVSLTQAVRGEARISFGVASPATQVANGAQLVGATIFRPDQGSLFFKARVKLTNASGVACFVGFTDQNADLEVPATAAPGLVTPATNAVGFLLDTRLAPTWQLVGVKNNVDAPLQDSGIAPTGGAYFELAIEISVTGEATFFIDGERVGTPLANAVATGVGLAMYAGGFSTNTTAKHLDVDRMRAVMPRVAV